MTPFKARELAEEIVLASRQDRYSKATAFRDRVESLIQTALEEAAEKEFLRLMGACWPNGMREDILSLLKTKTVQGEIDLNWMEDSIGEMLQLACQKAAAAEREACAKVAEEAWKTTPLGTAEEIAAQIRQRGRE